LIIGGQRIGIVYYYKTYCQNVEYYFIYGMIFCAIYLIPIISKQTT